MLPAYNRAPRSASGGTAWEVCLTARSFSKFLESLEDYRAGVGTCDFLPSGSAFKSESVAAKEAING